jgi:hypothetical protein
VLAGLIAWGGTVDPGKASLRWIFVAVLGCFGILSLFWKRATSQIERVYVKMTMLGIAIGSVAWLIPSSGSRALLAVAGVLIVLPLGLWIRAWLHNRQTHGDDTHRPR